MILFTRRGVLGRNSGRSFSISPAVSGKSVWNLDVDGPLNLSTAGVWTIVPTSTFVMNTKAWGGAGGPGLVANAPGGAGGGIQGTVTLRSGRSYSLVVGKGGSNNGAGALAGLGGAGRSESGGTGSGGGFSGLYDQFDTSIIIAGGGGGGGYGGNGGGGGGPAGQAGTAYSSDGTQGQGGTATTNGAGGLVAGNAGSGRAGGAASNGGNIFPGGGGGGGHKGGGGGSYNGGGGAGGGGGGSSYADSTDVTGATFYNAAMNVSPTALSSDRGTAGNTSNTASGPGVDGRVILT